MRTLHTGIRVADEERSIAFYAALGYEVVGRVRETPMGRLTMLKLPQDEFVSLELVHNPAPNTAQPGALNHLVLQVEDMKASIATLAGHENPTESPTSPDDSDDFLTAWVTDPDGVRIELVQWPAGHAAGMTREDFANQTDPPPAPSSTASAMTTPPTADFTATVARTQRAVAALLGGDPEPEKDLWSRRNDIILANPAGGFRRGWQEVETGLNLAARGFAGGRACTFHEVTLEAGTDLAYLFELERFTSDLTEGRGVVTGSLRVVMIFRLEDGAWKLVHRQADTLTETDDQEHDHGAAR
jgi:lactoylglutathione lyase